MRAVFYDTVFFLFKFGILITVFGGVCTGVEYQWHFSPPVPPEAVINVTISDNSTTNGTNSTLEGTDNGFTSLEDELASLEAEDTITFINGTWEDVNGTLVWSNISLPVDTNVRNPKEEKLFRGKKIGKLFLGHVFKEISTTHLPTQCAFECLQHVNCRSYNFNQKNHSCTLNDATHVEHYNSLVENEAFTYYVRDSYHVNKDALGLCMTYPCQNNGYCLDIKTQQGLPSYICICPEGWTGINCDTNADDIDWSEWQAWESCSVTCGTGWKQRRRSCVNKATLEDRSPLDCYGAEVESETCTLLPCPEWDSWSTWSPCSTHDTCGPGIKTRHRSCANRGTPGKDRYCMGPLIEHAPCHEVTCTAPVNLVDGNEYGQGVLQIYNDKSKTWGMVCSEGWGINEATVACRQLGLAGAAEAPVNLVDGNEYGQGVLQIYNDKSKTWGMVCSEGWGINEATVACRQLGLAGAAEALQNGPTKSYNLPFVLSGLSCLGNETAIQECTHNGWQSSSLCKDGHVVGIKCVVDGGWGDWSSWGECSVTCEDGIRIRTRQCDHPETLRGGQPCDGVAQQEKPCTLPPCPVDGVWKAWSEWETCSLSCGGGTQGRSRECDGPFYHGQNCSGPFTESRACNTHNCPIDGVWVTWSAWGTCNTTCGGGIQSRWRVCDGPFFGGANCSGPTEDFQPCNTHHCPVDGVWTNWTSWDTCNVTCGGGMQHRYRTCTGPFYGGLNCSGPDIDSKICNDFYCPVDGIWEAWTEWNSCNVSCGGGIQSRQRSCDGPFYGGANCSGPAVEYQDCHTHPCPIHGYWGVWSEWSTCNVSCGGGQQSRVRDCIAGLHGGSNCTGSNIEYQDCNPHHCPIDGKWRAWSAWTNCSGSCGTGQRSRFRTCAGPYYGGRNCTGDASQVEACNVHECPVDGIWKAWSNWTNCDVSCGGGTQNRTRECDGPYFLGEDCHGPTEEVRNCNTHECAVDGVWGNWTAWDTCSTSCGNGTQWRYRGCIGPFFGGKECQGNWNESQACNTHHCPVDGVFTSWSEWSNCTVQCGGGTRWKDRTCDGPYHGGKNCEGAWSESETCNTHKCPIDGVWRQWSNWDNCSVSCGGGIQWRYRDCDGPYHKGRDCEGSWNESQACNSHPCPIPGDWMEWSPWGECSATCGGGIRYSTRVCDMESYGNLTIDCIGNNTKTGPCHVFSCDPALNCEDWVRRGLTVSTYGPIDPDGPDGFVQPFTVFCNITEERAYTVVGHNNEEPVQVIGYEGAGEYQLALIYGSPGFPPVSALQLAFLVDTSTECKQFISWKCYSATIHHPTSREIVTTFWANRDGEFRYYWGGAPPGSDMCACGVNGTCHKPGTVCNCDANDATWREDAGWITYKPDLPVTDFYAGDTGVQGVEEGYHYLGPLVCSEKDYDTDN
ncbi:SCO-spondin [Lingula anatina]|uniref:SCO-spondin n=1 Tax=Lingula anatina TaxID=7574 RepID=A0A1S3IHR4_LINAN|nr:SCO-spondin [Lingula anatina]|eukprot:XP_013397757.1 SCO-spondin [Lingula anatina]